MLGPLVFGAWCLCFLNPKSEMFTAPSCRSVVLTKAEVLQDDGGPKSKIEYVPPTSNIIVPLTLSFDMKEAFLYILSIT